MVNQNNSPREAYKIGEAYDFRVRLQFGNFCEVIDEATGITAFLHDTDKLKTRLFKNQVIRCTVTGIEDKHPRIELTDAAGGLTTNLLLTEDKLTSLLDGQQIQWNTREFVRLLTNDEKDKDFETLCFRWIQGLISKKADLHIVCDDCRNLLEMSDLLNICGDVEREYYESRLTIIIDQLDCYIKAEEHIAVGQSDKFIDGLFTKLRTSGFVYHPETSFNILSSMFLMKPELMNVKMGELISIIGEKAIRTWSKEPFRSALAKLLELYIRERENHLGTAQVSEQSIKQDIHAIALQLLLLGNSSNMGITDIQLNKARLCYACSYENTVAPEKLVDAAYFHLFHSSAKLPVYKMDSLQLLPFHISNMPSRDIDTVNSYTQSQCRLTVTPEGICLSPTGVSKELYPVFPKSMQLWKNFQVMLPYRLDYDLSGSDQGKFRQLQDAWHDIEAELFNRKISFSPHNNKTVRYENGDKVAISITGQDELQHGVFFCQIEDGSGSEGFIHLKDIIPYTLSPTLRHFIGANGNRMVFNATVIGENDGYYRFSMRDGLSDFYTNYYDEGEEIICSIGGKVNTNGLAPAISNDGISISLINAREFPYVQKGTVVVCRIVGPGRGGFPYRGEIIEKSLESYDLFVSFKRLMKNYAIGTIADVITKQEEKQIQESDRILDESYVREVIRLVDRMSTLENDYFKSYSYLGFARMLAMLIGWEEQTAYYKGRMDIIAMFHYFAVNARIEDNDIEQLEKTNVELYSNYPFLSDKFHQLQAVSYMGKPEHNRELLDLAEGNTLLKPLSQLVLAYNITKESGMKTVTVDIQNKIRQLLNLKDTEVGLKMYAGGEEDEEIEYKSSLIFSPEDHRTNPLKQMEEVLKVIDSFLNTRGGTLYVGVSDTGHGTGLEPDLENDYFNGDRDKLLRAIPDAISLKWGNHIAASYIESISYDQENKDKTVLIVRIKAHPTGIPFDGVYYVRVGSTKRKLTKEEYDEYCRTNRSAVIEVTPIETEDLAEPTEDKPVLTPFISSKEADIATSRQRKNILTEYMDPDNYEEPIAFFKFLGDAKFQKTEYYDYDDNSLLTLAVKESERDDYLVLAYANGHIVKVPVAQLLKCGSGSYSRYSGSRLMFASIAGKDDAILNIVRDNKTRSHTLMRLDRLKNYPEGRITDGGGVVYKESLLGHPIDFEIINEKDLGLYSTIIDMSPKHLGWSVNETTMPIVNQLTTMGIGGLS